MQFSNPKNLDSLQELGWNLSRTSGECDAQDVHWSQTRLNGVPQDAEPLCTPLEVNRWTWTVSYIMRQWEEFGRQRNCPRMQITCRCLVRQSELGRGNGSGLERVDHFDSWSQMGCQSLGVSNQAAGNLGWFTVALRHMLDISNSPHKVHIGMASFGLYFLFPNNFLSCRLLPFDRCNLLTWICGPGGKDVFAGLPEACDPLGKLFFDVIHLSIVCLRRRPLDLFRADRISSKVFLILRIRIKLLFSLTWSFSVIPVGVRLRTPAYWTI